MTPLVGCPFEEQVLASVVEDHWPLTVEPSLREHVAQCHVCAEAVGVAALFREANTQSHNDANLPDASRVWWLAQMRARREANADAARPILATQVVAGAWAAGLLFVCLGAAFAWVQSTRIWIESVVTLASSLLLSHGVEIAFGAAFIVLLPTAAYFAMGKE